MVAYNADGIIDPETNKPVNWLSYSLDSETDTSGSKYFPTKSEFDWK